jgi:hypothetical protein
MIVVLLCIVLLSNIILNYQNRTSLLLNTPLEDKVSDGKNESQAIIFANGFGGVTNMKVGPDGYLYVLYMQVAMIVVLFINQEIYASLIQNL